MKEKLHEKAVQPFGFEKQVLHFEVSFPKIKFTGLLHYSISSSHCTLNTKATSCDNGILCVDVLSNIVRGLESPLVSGKKQKKFISAHLRSLFA